MNADPCSLRAQCGNGFWVLASADGKEVGAGVVVWFGSSVQFET